MSERLQAATNHEKIEQLEDIALYVRTKALESIVNANNGHIGGNLSSVELLTTLYFGGQFNFDPDNTKNENRDRVLIRGHEGPLRYTIFSLLGYIDPEELKAYRSLGSRLQGHEDMHETPGVDITPSGSLGMLLSYGVGSAIANKDRGLESRTIVFLGDGEEQEGNVSEAARHAGTLGLDNLICIIDKNSKQLSRPTADSDGNSDLGKIWEGYGWNVLKINNGHDIEEITKVYENLQHVDLPTVVIANTVKGFGVDGAADHFSGYHTLSAASDKSVVLGSLDALQNDLTERDLNHDNIARLALSVVNRPDRDTTFIRSREDKPQLYDIRTTAGAVNLEEAQHNYMMELKRRILEGDGREDFYFITPDLLRSDIVEEGEFKKFSHYIDTGIREQHAIAMSHGISVENPAARIYVCYGDAFAYRALDQINAAATSHSNIMIVGENSGLFQGQNGKTHQSVGQSSALMSIPELEFYEPADAIDLHNVYSQLLTDNKGVSYVRFHRGTVNIDREAKDADNTDAYFVHKSDHEPDIVIASSGFTVDGSVRAARQMEMDYGINANVINVVNHKRIGNKIIELTENEAPIITVYNGNPKTLTHAVSTAILENGNVPRPSFIAGHGFESGTTGKVDELFRHFGLDETGIINFTMESLTKWRKK